MRWVSALAGLLMVTVLAVGCGSDEGRITGTVVGYEGGTGGVVSFEVVSTSGDRITFEPAPGVDRFAHGGPLTHLVEHLQTGAPVEVTYRVEGGVHIALEVADG